jgi:hypothetical protein
MNAAPFWLVPFHLHVAALAVVALLSGGVGAFGADATRPVDTMRRHESLTPAEATPQPKQKPGVNPSVQEKRIDKPTFDKQRSPVEAQKAGVDVSETRPKQVREKSPYPFEVREQPTSPLNHRLAGVSTASDAVKPPRVAKYQDSLAAASATNMARFPALDGATSAKINRFVFRRNPPEPQSGVRGQPLIPAAGGAVPRK